VHHHNCGVIRKLDNILFPAAPPPGIAALTSFVPLYLGAKRASEQGTSSGGSAVKPAACRPLRR
jgi:hypothetical protein